MSTSGGTSTTAATTTTTVVLSSNNRPEILKISLPTPLSSNNDDHEKHHHHHHQQQQQQSSSSESKNQFSVNKFFCMMKYERLRLITYLLYGHQWPKMEAISPSELAKAGFFYLTDDSVQCTFCRGVIRDWTLGDNAMEEHKRLYPNCPFVRGEYCGNMPIEIDPDVNSNKHHQYSSFFPMQMPTVGRNQSGTVDYNKTDMPRFPRANDPLFRSRSFVSGNWKCPIDYKQFVDAGFFYTNKSDRTICFHCGGKLENWSENESPLEEHARFFPECYFMIQSRGQSYIEYVQFKTQIIELRKKMNTGESIQSKNQDIDHMKSITYENFLKMKQSAQRMLAKLEQGKDKANLNLAYQRYLSKLFFLIDCQQLYQYLQNLDIMQPPLSPTTATAQNNSNSSDLSSNSLNSSVFSLEDNTNTNDNDDGQNLASHHQSSDEEDNTNAHNNNKQTLLCKICCDKQIQVVFVPCGHQLTCKKCADRLQHCPICRHEIKSKVRTYFA